MEKEGYQINEIYQGGYSSLDPNKGHGTPFTGYHTKFSDMALTTDPRNANQLKETSDKLSTGVKKIELALVSPETFDAMPNTQLKEINQLSKLTGIDVSVHAPVMDSAGMSQQGFSEVERRNSERKIANAILRSNEVNPSGNVPVVFHSSEGLPSSQLKKTKDGIGYEKLIAVNQEDGKMIPLEEEQRFNVQRSLRPEIREKLRSGQMKQSELKKEHLMPLEKGKILTPQERLDSYNQTQWDNSLSQLIFNQERVQEIMQRSAPLLNHVEQEISEKIKKGEDLDKIKSSFERDPEQKRAFEEYRLARSYLDDIEQNLNSIFSNAYKYGDDTQKVQLKKISENFEKNLDNGGGLMTSANALQGLLGDLKNPALAPELFVPVEEFAVKKSSESFGNAAFKAYQKYKDKAPIIAIENPPVGQALSTGEDLRNLVVESRKKFVENAVNEGLSKKQAEKTAEKLIGATWDVGHINMLRKQGFTDEDIIKETEKVKPFVKHVHLSDNFGFEHTELPMGMGNVPMKEIMEKLGEKGYSARKVIEAAQWWQHFKTAPVAESAEGMGSPMYLGGGAPYWNQRMGLYQGYSSGMSGPWLPQINYETFGAGFSQLPTELGGQRPGAQGSRMSGRGME